MLVNKDLIYPTPYHDTWNVLDSTKLKSFLTCPRMYFFEYVLGWRSERSNNHLIFGEGMHRALKVMLEYGIGKGMGFSDDVIVAAYAAFEEYYRQHFTPDTDEIFAPKTPDRLLAGLEGYSREYPHDKDEYELIYTEVSGNAPISEDMSIFFRIDAVLRDISSGQILVLEHKSTGRSFSRTWKDQWLLDHQPFVYTHALYSQYNPEEIKGVLINGIGFLKTKLDYTRVPCWKTPRHMNGWLVEVNRVVGDMKREFVLLSQEDGRDDVMKSFNRNTTACTKYFGCTYHDFCATWQNPLRHCDAPPLGYKVEYWDPREGDSNVVWGEDN